MIFLLPKPFSSWVCDERLMDLLIVLEVEIWVLFYDEILSITNRGFGFKWGTCEISGALNIALFTHVMEAITGASKGAEREEWFDLHGFWKASELLHSFYIWLSTKLEEQPFESLSPFIAQAWETFISDINKHHTASPMLKKGLISRRTQTSSASVCFSICCRFSKWCCSLNG